MESILITGASTGIGRTTALHLVERGFQVFAGVRSVASAASLEKAVRDGGLKADLMRVVRLDVSKEATIETVVTEIDQAVGRRGLKGLVNNAGIVAAGPLEALPIERIREQFDVNVFGLLRVTQMALPLLRRGRGRVVNVSSISGRISTPGIGAYSASKFAVEALSDALRREVADQGLFVSLIEPGPIQTPIWDKSKEEAQWLESDLPEDLQRLYASLLAKLKTMHEASKKSALPPMRVARVIEEALTVPRPKARYPVGTSIKAAALMARVLLDVLMDRMVQAQMLR